MREKISVKNTFIQIKYEEAGARAGAKADTCFLEQAEQPRAKKRSDSADGRLELNEAPGELGRLAWLVLSFTKIHGRTSRKVDLPAIRPAKKRGSYDVLMDRKASCPLPVHPIAWNIVCPKPKGWVTT